MTPSSLQAAAAAAISATPIAELKAIVAEAKAYARLRRKGAPDSRTARFARGVLGLDVWNSLLEQKLQHMDQQLHQLAQRVDALEGARGKAANGKQASKGG